MLYVFKNFIVIKIEIKRFCKNVLHHQNKSKWNWKFSVLHASRCSNSEVFRSQDISNYTFKYTLSVFEVLIRHLIGLHFVLTCSSILRTLAWFILAHYTLGAHLQVSQWVSEWVDTHLQVYHTGSQFVKPTLCTLSRCCHLQINSDKRAACTKVRIYA